MTQAPNATVYVVDDSEAVRNSLAALLAARGYEVRTFGTSGAFLDELAALAPGSVMLDLRLPDSDGMTVLARIVEARAPLAVIVMTGHADIPLAIRTIREGAVDFIEKPFRWQQLEVSLRRAHRYLDQLIQTLEHINRLESLTPRERDVVGGIVDGKTSKEIARDFGISHRTVEAHRANIMEKMGVTTLASLVRIASRDLQHPDTASLDDDGDD